VHARQLRPGAAGALRRGLGQLIGALRRLRRDHPRLLRHLPSPEPVRGSMGSIGEEAVRSGCAVNPALRGCRTAGTGVSIMDVGRRSDGTSLESATAGMAALLAQAQGWGGAAHVPAPAQRPPQQTWRPETLRPGPGPELLQRYPSSSPTLTC
jgi:hypothetical protein